MSNLKVALGRFTDLGQVAVLLFIYLVVMGVATSVLPARPGDWEFALAMMLPLPIVAFGLRKTVFTVRGNISPITELTVIAAALAMCLIAMIGSRPGMNGSVTYLPAAIVASAAIALGEKSSFAARCCGDLRALRFHLGHRAQRDRLRFAAPGGVVFLRPVGPGCRRGAGLVVRA
jgi:energy-converting hydrogenase Eha subunit A